MHKKGFVYLVGAGCGSADLITVRGLRLLQSCDAVVYDDLIDPALLAQAAHAEQHPAGKRCGRHSMPQSEINSLLVRLGQSGKTVVRLKGGDPFVFGRGGEEFLALQAAGVPCEEVPGISSCIAVPAAAGIPVTHRGASRSFHVITGHTAQTGDTLPESLEALAALHPRIVVKLPCTATGIRAVKYFAAKNIRTNCTLVFSVGQALLAAKAGATYVSPFVGRLDDISEDGVALVAHIVKVYRTYGYKTQVLAASIRHTQHIIQCLDAGTDVATCPLAAIEGLLRHPLTNSGLEKFLADHARLNT